MDIACGAGEPAFLTANRVGTQGHVLGLDIAQNMVDECIAYAKVKNAPGCKSYGETEWIARLLSHGLLEASYIPNRAQQELWALIVPIFFTRIWMMKTLVPSFAESLSRLNQFTRRFVTSYVA